MSHFDRYSISIERQQWKNWKASRCLGAVVKDSLYIHFVSSKMCIVHWNTALLNLSCHKGFTECASSSWKFVWKQYPLHKVNFIIFKDIFIKLIKKIFSKVYFHFFFLNIVWGTLWLYFKKYNSKARAVQCGTKVRYHAELLTIPACGDRSFRNKNSRQLFIVLFYIPFLYYLYAWVHLSDPWAFRVNVALKFSNFFQR